jgi:hypothetical protein
MHAKRSTNLIPHDFITLAAFVEEFYFHFNNED